ncbi:MAG: cell division transport system permease protein [Parcubacteria bacterium C7867-003]|nr:MAG: cell division transport system permease protein [Parcubacteria bacterium C7867-003]
MFWLKAKRIVRAGFFSFWRNGFISLSSILVMVVTLFVIGSVIFSSVVLKTTLDQIKDKVDINVYFFTTADENEILAMKKSLEQLPEVLSVEYVTREQVLADFRKRHENDQSIIGALGQLDENPLGATLNIKAKNPSQYEGIARYIESKRTSSVGVDTNIDNVNYFKNKDAIDRLTKIINSANSLGLVLTLFLVAISILITFNTIRLVIYMSRDEISVMRLVGASDRYIRGPFFVAGSIYGFVSAIITLMIFYPLTLWLGGETANFFVGLNVFHYYLSHFGEIFLIIVGSGIAIGSISSYLAVRKYLKV